MNPLHELSEHTHQRTLFAWWAMACHSLGVPEHALFAIPNGGARNKITGRMLKDEGVIPGVPDICLALPNDSYHGLYIELKREKGGRVSQDQKHMLDLLSDRGYRAVVCHGFDEAQREILAYVSIARSKERKNTTEQITEDGINER